MLKMYKIWYYGRNKTVSDLAAAQTDHYTFLFQFTFAGKSGGVTIEDFF